MESASTIALFPTPGAPSTSSCGAGPASLWSITSFRVRPLSAQTRFTAVSQSYTSSPIRRWPGFNGASAHSASVPAAFAAAYSAASACHSSSVNGANTAAPPPRAATPSLTAPPPASSATPSPASSSGASSSAALSAALRSCSTLHSSGCSTPSAQSRAPPCSCSARARAAGSSSSAYAGATDASMLAT